MGYTYSILKFVPDAARGESVNLGAVAGDDQTGDWEFRAISNFVRARAMDDTDSLAGALAFVGEIEDRIAALDMLTADVAAMSSSLLDTWSGEMRNVVQFTLPKPVRADSAAEALDLVFQQLVVDPGRREFRFEKKVRAVSSTVSAYRAAGVPDEAVLKRVAVHANRFSDSFDLGVANGELHQLVKCWSFQLPSQSELAEQVKAWAWLVERLGEFEGRAIVGDRTYPVARHSADLSVVFVSPIRGQSSPAFEEALAVFDRLDIPAVDASAARQVAERAASRIEPRATSRGLWR